MLKGQPDDQHGNNVYVIIQACVHGQALLARCEILGFQGQQRTLHSGKPCFIMQPLIFKASYEQLVVFTLSQQLEPTWQPSTTTTTPTTIQHTHYYYYYYSYYYYYYYYYY